MVAIRATMYIGISRLTLLAWYEPTLCPRRFLRKVPKSEEGLTRKSRINVAKTYVVKAASLNEACIRLPQLLSINEDISNLEFPLINWSQ